MGYESENESKGKSYCGASGFFTGFTLTINSSFFISASHSISSPCSNSHNWISGFGTVVRKVSPCGLALPSFVTNVCLLFYLKLYLKLHLKLPQII